MLIKIKFLKMNLKYNLINIVYLNKFYEKK